MNEEIIVIQQKIKITYNNNEARHLALARLLKDTNWFYISEGEIQDKANQYTLSKTTDISIPFQS